MLKHFTFPNNCYIKHYKTILKNYYQKLFFKTILKNKHQNWT